MQSFLKDPIQVSLDNLYPDPNNPRLGDYDAPGYDDTDMLFSEETRKKILGELGETAYSVDELVTTVLGQGWMPIDNVLVWNHPEDGERYVVVEGNRRRLALERVHAEVLPKAKKKLQRMLNKKGPYTPQDIRVQEEEVSKLEQIVSDTKTLTVVPVDAADSDELAKKLPRVLAVRHIAGSKDWGSFAADLWVLHRYSHLFAAKHGPNASLAWEDDLVHQVAAEASLSAVKARRSLKSASWFNHFKAEWEDELPEGEEFKDTDYFLFELIALYPWVRQKLEIADTATCIPPEGEQVLFDWVFKHPRTPSADDNPNVFHAHQNIRVWKDMNRFDEKHKTSFALRFDVGNHKNAPMMHEVEADWLNYKARSKPADILDSLMKPLRDLKAETLVNEGEFLKVQLQELQKLTSKFLDLIDAGKS